MVEPPKSGFMSSINLSDENYYWSESSGTCSAKYASGASRVLFITVADQPWELSEAEFYQTFSRHHGLERIVILRKVPYLQALVQYNNIDRTISAQAFFDGRYIYDNCFRLIVEFSDKFFAPKDRGKQLTHTDFAASLLCRDIYMERCSCSLTCHEVEFEPTPLVLVSIHNLLYPVTVDILHQVFGVYGEVLEIEIVEECPTLQARVKYHFARYAVNATNSLNGVNIYDGCCNLEVELLYERVRHKHLLLEENDNEGFHPELSDETGKFTAQIDEPLVQYPQGVTIADPSPTNCMQEELKCGDIENILLSSSLTQRYKPEAITGMQVMPNNPFIRLSNMFDVMSSNDVIEWPISFDATVGKHLACGFESHKTSTNNIADTSAEIKMFGPPAIDPWPSWKHIEFWNMEEIWMIIVGIRGKVKNPIMVHCVLNIKLDAQWAVLCAEADGVVLEHLMSWLNYLDEFVLNTTSECMINSYCADDVVHKQVAVHSGPQNVDRVLASTTTEQISHATITGIATVLAYLALYADTFVDHYSGLFTHEEVGHPSYFPKFEFSVVILPNKDFSMGGEDDAHPVVAWNLAMASGTCLGLVARTVGDEIVELVMPFIEDNISKPTWRQRAAVTFAFWSISEGPSPDTLTNIVNFSLHFMLTTLTTDPNILAKDKTDWTLGRLFEFLHGSTVDTPIITQENCRQIVTTLLQSMEDAPTAAEKACGALYFLVHDYKDVDSFSHVAPFFREMVRSLLNVPHREDVGESRLRTATYETLNEVVRCSTDETAPMVLQLIPVIMKELHQTLEAQNLSSDERVKQSEIRGLLCGYIQVIIQKLGSSHPSKYAFLQYADQILILFLKVFACKKSTVCDKAMLAIRDFAYATGPEFVNYMPELYKYLAMGLQIFEHQVCAVTMGMVGDILRALEDKIFSNSYGIMTQPLKDLSSNQLHHSVKPQNFSCFGDVALEIGENFEKYLMYAIPMLQGAANMPSRMSRADVELTGYTTHLTNGILETYSCIFQGFENSPTTHLFIPYAPLIPQFLGGIYVEKDKDDSGGTLSRGSFVQWSEGAAGTWALLSILRKDFPGFHLEDKVIFESGRVDTGIYAQADTGTEELDDSTTEEDDGSPSEVIRHYVLK